MDKDEVFCCLIYNPSRALSLDTEVKHLQKIGYSTGPKEIIAAMAALRLLKKVR